MPSRMNRSPVATSGASIAYESASTASRTVAAAMYGEKRDSAERGSFAPSRTAAIGGTRVARKAGESPANSVTRVPTSSETTIVRVAKTVSVCGRSRLSAMKSSFRPTASPSPANSPMIDASRPITNASTITEVSTCRRDAPTVRSVANSRVRCATVIDSVLKITKAPTNRAMPANDSRKYRMMLVNVEISSESSVACSAPDRTVTDVPSSSRMRATSSSGATPSCGGGLHRVELALLVQERLGGRDVEDRERGAAERAQIAVPRDSDDLELLGGAEGRDADPVADGEVLLVGNPLVDRELLRARRPATLDEVERIEAVVLGRGLDAEREGGGASRVDRLAVRLEQLGLEVGHRAGRHFDAVDVPDLLEDVLRDRRGLRLLALEADVRRPCR